MHVLACFVLFTVMNDAFYEINVKPFTKERERAASGLSVVVVSRCGAGNRKVGLRVAQNRGGYGCHGHDG